MKAANSQVVLVVIEDEVLAPEVDTAFFLDVLVRLTLHGDKETGFVTLDELVDFRADVALVLLLVEGMVVLDDNVSALDNLMLDDLVLGLVFRETVLLRVETLLVVLGRLPVLLVAAGGDGEAGFVKLGETMHVPFTA